MFFALWMAHRMVFARRTIFVVRASTACGGVSRVSRSGLLVLPAEAEDRGLVVYDLRGPVLARIIHPAKSAERLRVRWADLFSVSIFFPFDGPLGVDSV